MECVYRRRNGESSVFKGVLERRGGYFVLFAEEGKAVDRMFPKKASMYEGSLYLATTDMEKGLEIPLERPNEEKKAVISNPVRRRVAVPPPPEGSLVFNSRAYIEPSLLKHFKDYQIEGVKFVFERLRTSEGAMLADEMGLGKTFQAIGVIYMFCKAGGKVLVAAPCSLVGVWEREIRKWVGALRIFNGIEKSLSKYTGSEDVLILSYERIPVSKPLERFEFSLVVCDEAHRLRTGTSQILSAMKKISSKKLLLTGTPFQNSVQEYRTLLGLVDLRAEGAKEVRDLTRIAEEAVLRRKIERTSVKLPKKEEIIWIIKNQEYAEYLKYYNGISSSEDRSKVHIHEIQKLRVFLNKSPSKWRVFSSLCREILNAQESLVIITRYIEAVRHARKIIEGMCARGEIKLKKEDVVEFHGNMGVKERERALRLFQERGQKVVVLSAKCGAEGLTLVKATQMIIIDSDWNPANDMQAMARVWRLGQLRPVRIHRLFLMGTVEEYVLLVQLKKIKVQKEIEGESPPEEVEMRLSQCEEEPKSLEPRETSIVHEWMRCGCTKEAPFLSATEYSHMFIEENILLKVETNSEE